VDERRARRIVFSRAVRRERPTATQRGQRARSKSVFVEQDGTRCCPTPRTPSAPMRASLPGGLDPPTVRHRCRRTCCTSSSPRASDSRTAPTRPRRADRARRCRPFSGFRLASANGHSQSHPRPPVPGTTYAEYYLSSQPHVVPGLATDDEPRDGLAFGSAAIAWWALLRRMEAALPASHRTQHGQIAVSPTTPLRALGTPPSESRRRCGRRVPAQMWPAPHGPECAVPLPQGTCRVVSCAASITCHARTSIRVSTRREWPRYANHPRVREYPREGACQRSGRPPAARSALCAAVAFLRGFFEQFPEVPAQPVPVTADVAGVRPHKVQVCKRVGSGLFRAD
jgi:hypothetical protein